MIDQWKCALLEDASGVSERGGRKRPAIDEGQVQELHAKIGELAVAKSFFGKKVEALGRDVERSMIEPEHLKLSIGQQCNLFSIA